MSGEGSTPNNNQEHERLRMALRESEILRELAELLASSLDLKRILQVLAKRTTEVCEVERCAVWLLDAQKQLFVPATYYLLTQNVHQDRILAGDEQWYHSSLPYNDPVMRRLLEQDGMLVSEDLQAEPTMRKFAKKFLVRSTLLVALIREGRVVGMMSLDDPAQLHGFSQAQQQLARAIGQQAALAIDNAQLYQQAQEERKRAERLIERARAIYQVALTVNSGESLPKVLAIASDSLASGISADTSAVALLETETMETLRVLIPAHTRQQTIRLTDLPTCVQTALTGTPQYVSEEQVSGSEREWLRSLNLSNVMIVPLMVGTEIAGNAHSLEAGRCVGFIFASYHNPRHHPARGQYAFAQDIAAQCALAIEKERLLEEARQSAVLATERASTLDAIFQAMTEGITFINMDGNVEVRNTAASYFLGVPMHSSASLHSFLERHPTYTLRGQPILEEDFPLSRALRGENIRRERFVTHRTDGAERVIEVNISRLLDNSQQQTGIVSAFRDVTEQTRAERRIRQALETVLHVAEAVSGVTDMRDILHSVLTRTMETLNCDRGIVQLYDQEQGLFTSLLAAGYATESDAAWLTDPAIWTNAVPTDEHDFRAIILGGHATVIPASQCPQQPEPHQHRAILAAPITHSERILGLMMLDRSPNYQLDPIVEQQRHEFSIWDLAVAEGIAQLAGMAIEQTRWQQEAATARTREETMRESNALKDEFLAITAHEFRSPLTVIIMQAQAAERALRKYSGQDLEQRVTTALTAIQDQGRHLTDIVSTFLEVARLNEGQVEVSTSSTDMAALAQQVVASLSETSPLHELHCVITPTAHPYLVRGESARLQQVLDNLLQNAIKYSAFGGPITVSLQQYCNDDGKTVVEVCVADTGIGIPKDEQARLFERFYRAPSIKGSGTRGVGLGLYIVARLVRMHGGDIHVESAGIPGEGSRFIFTLPIIESDTELSEGTSELAPQTGRGDNAH